MLLLGANECMRACTCSLWPVSRQCWKKSKPNTHTHSDWMKKCTRCDHALYLMQIRTSAPFDWLLPLPSNVRRSDSILSAARAHVLAKKQTRRVTQFRKNACHRFRAAVLRSRAAQYPPQIATQQSFTPFTQSCIKKLLRHVYSAMKMHTAYSAVQLPVVQMI